MINFRKRSILGVDIGSNAVKVVEVRRGRDQPVVMNAGFREIDIRKRRDGLPDREATMATLRDLLYENGIKTKEAIALLQGPSTAFFRIHLPKLPAKELKSAVRWEVTKQSPFPLDGAVLSSQLFKEVTDRDGLRRMALFACAVEEQFALDQAALLKEAGLVPVGMRTAPSALWQLAKQNPPTPSDQITVLLDLGAQVGTIAFFSGGELQFAREIATAGAAITEALTGAVITERGKIQLDFYQAEKLKRQYGIPEEDEGSLGEGIPSGQLRAMIRPALERLVVEIQRSFTYFADHFGEIPVGRVLLSGGTARLKNLAPFLTQRLGVKVELLNPFASVGLNPSLRREGLPEVATRFAIPVGLALDRTSRLDLLPSPLKFERRMAQIKVGVRAFLFVLFFSAIFSYALERGRIASYQQAFRQKQEALSSLKPHLEAMQQLQEERARLLPQLQAYEALLKTAISWPGLLKELSLLTPNAITLEELSPGQDGRLHVKGLSFTQGEAAEMVLARYLSNLRGSPFFREVDLVTTAEKEGYVARAVGFEVILTVR
ncbi:MAG: type IV pilus assembly protein PilM [candidate division NC10 bacterium]|nr:type IV pilus assembly protein PilM [candidate division NC10 bacterium]